MPIERNEKKTLKEVAKKHPETRSQIRTASQLIQGEILNGVFIPWKGTPPTTNSAPMDTQAAGDKKFVSGEVAINVETRSQNRTTSQLVRGEIPTGVYFSWKGASNESFSTPKDD